MTFDVIDCRTRLPVVDLEQIALDEEWAKHLVYCDISGFAITEYGDLLLYDDCGNIAFPPRGRFEIVFH